MKTDVIIHDVNRVDVYPNTDNGKGISSWFRVGLMGTYHRGILLGLRWVSVERISDNEVKEVDNLDSSANAILIGEVPYDSIESVNFDGDNYYNKPHIFCHFEFNGQPYERLFYGEPFRLNEKHPEHYTDIGDYLPKRSWWKFWQRS